MFAEGSPIAQNKGNNSDVNLLQIHWMVSGVVSRAALSLNLTVRGCIDQDEEERIDLLQTADEHYQMLMRNEEADVDELLDVFLNEQVIQDDQLLALLEDCEMRESGGRAAELAVWNDRRSGNLQLTALKSVLIIIIATELPINTSEHVYKSKSN